VTLPNEATLPTVLIVDDVFGRTVSAGNRDRANLCSTLHVNDVTPDSDAATKAQKVTAPVANAVFSRGQTPKSASQGDTVRNDPEGVLRLVKAGPAGDGSSPWALVLLDLSFSQGLVTAESETKGGSGIPRGEADDRNSHFGFQLLADIHASSADIPVVMLSSVTVTPELERQWNVAGASGFLKRTTATGDDLRGHLERHGLFPDSTGQIIGRSRALLDTLKQARMAALSDRHVLLRGESGVGKESMARYVHDMSRRKDFDFVALSLVAIMESVAENELFGHTTGYFYKGSESQDGLFRDADKGTLFLDEIGAISEGMQKRLLRVLENGEVRTHGRSEPYEVDVRVVSATNEDIENRARASTFREDLLYRLSAGGTIALPPLAKRREDIPLLAEAFLSRKLQENGDAKPPLYRDRNIDARAMAALEAHEWRGNIRELKSVIEQAVERHPDNTLLTRDHLSLAKANGPAPLAREAPALPKPNDASPPYELPRYMEALRSYVSAILDGSRDDNGKIIITKAYKRMVPKGSVLEGEKVTQIAAGFLLRLAKLGTPHLSLRDCPQLEEALQLARDVKPLKEKKADD